MAASPVRRSVVFRTVFAGVCAILLSLPLPGQIPLTVEQAASRLPPDFVPAYANRLVAVKGQVAAIAYHFLYYTMLAVQQDKGGIVLLVPREDTRLDAFQPGDELEVTGT